MKVIEIAVKDNGHVSVQMEDGAEIYLGKVEDMEGVVSQLRSAIPFAREDDIMRAARRIVRYLDLWDVLFDENEDGEGVENDENG